MAFTQTQLDAIDAAIASGELTVSFGDRSVTYRSMSDLRRARELIKAEMQTAGTLPAVTRTSYASRGRS